jgi:hypothetical protein
MHAMAKWRYAQAAICGEHGSRDLPSEGRN